MQELADALERVASAVVVADAGDLQLLADLHTQMQTLERHPELARHGVHLQQKAQHAEKLIEQIILHDVADADAALRQISAEIAEMQVMLVEAAQTGTLAPQEPAAATAPEIKTEAAPANAAAEAPMPATEPAMVRAEDFTEAALNPDDLPLVQEFIIESRGHLETAEAELLKVEDNPQDIEAVNAIFRSFHTIKGVAGFLNLRQIGALAHASENLLDMARKGQLALAGAAVDLVLESADCMKAMIDALAAAAEAGGALPIETRLPPLLGRLRAFAADPSAAPAENRAGPIPVAETAPAAEAAASAAASNPASAARTAHETTVKVATDRLDNLIDTVGELVIAQAMVSQDAVGMEGTHSRLCRNVSHLGKLTRELQDLSMAMRMVPIQGVFQKMARLVRDLARKAMKDIELAVIGGDTELDRNVVEAISDPLVHMVRNAADHGLETPDERVAAGKPRTGKLTLRAAHQAGSVVIEIADDGRGLNRDKILKKAIAAGIVREDEQLDDQQIYKLIFHAGLSTADKITDVSGRGVGMDVVSKNVEALRGRIEINSTQGQGTTFTIRLPLTLAVIDGLVVRVGAQRYIIPLTSIEQSLRPKAEQLSSLQGRGEMCVVRAKLLPVFRLYKLLGVTPSEEDTTRALLVIVQDDSRMACLQVDEIIGQQQVVIKSLGEGVGTTRGIAGGAILGDGNVSLILDIPGIIDLGSR